MEISRKIQWITVSTKKQESITVGCVSSTWKPYMFQLQWPSPDVTPMVWEVPQMNKFEQVTSDLHQMSLTGGSPCLKSMGVGVP